LNRLIEAHQGERIIGQLDALQKQF
jgi:hypothetical protein